MPLNNLGKVLGFAVGSICTIFAVAKPAQAIDFRTPTSEWTYVNDSFRDGTDGVLVGVGRSSAFEMFGMAFKEVGNELFIGINSNLDITGQYRSYTPNDQNIGYGDLFFNFEDGATLHEASAQQKLYGIRFAGTNNSGVSETGVYSNVTAMNVTSFNNGWRNFNSYQNWVNNHSKDKYIDANENVNLGEKGEVGFGDLTQSEANDYLNKKNGQIVEGNHQTLNSIQSGTKVGNITMLSQSELDSLAFATDNNPEYANAKTFGFKFDRSLLPDGDAIISLLAECINDGMAMKISLENEFSSFSADVPEPTSIVSLGLIGLALAGIRKKSEQ